MKEKLKLAKLLSSSLYNNKKSVWWKPASVWLNTFKRNLFHPWLNGSLSEKNTSIARERVGVCGCMKGINGWHRRKSRGSLVALDRDNARFLPTFLSYCSVRIYPRTELHLRKWLFLSLLFKMEDKFSHLRVTN